MRRHVAAGALAMMAAVCVEAQTPPSSGAFARGRELMGQGDPLEAADAFHEALRGGPAGRHTVRVGVYCDIANLERQVRASGNAPELFVLRRSLEGRPCLALYWGLFPSRAAARAAVTTIPVPLRAPGQSPVLVSQVLPPGAPPPARTAAVPPPAPPVEPAVPPPAAAVPARPKPVAEAPLAEAPAVVPEAPLPAVREEPLPPMPTPAEAGVRVPALEITGAYSALWDDVLAEDGGDGFLEAGWMLSLCGNLNRSIGVVGEVSGHYTSRDTLDAFGAPLAEDWDLLGVQAGPRYTHRGGGAAVPYVQAVVGWTRTGVELAGIRRVEDAFSVQPGVGLNLRLSRSVGLGLGADYRLVFGEPDNRNELRLHAGLVLAIGDR
jgi:hypothetical protein